MRINLLLKGAMVLAAAGLFTFLGACNREEEETDLVPSFQYAASEDNFLEINFTNFSQNASSYSWDFGDGETSTEENPTHVYSEAGDYDVTLTASDDEGNSETRTETVSVVDPGDALRLLAGDVSKDWILLREGVALGVGPTPGSVEWWSFGEAVPLGDRPCILDDTYTFFNDGTFGFESNNTFWLDEEQFGGWNDDIGAGCQDEGMDGVFTGSDGGDYSAFANGGDYTYTYDGEELTLDGLGAYIGLASKTTAGDSKTPIASKTYNVLRLVDGDGVDSLVISLEGADQSWTFYLVSYENAADMPDIPAALPAADFSFEKNDFTVSFTNASNNATSYTWDFGDGNSSTDENPTHTYAAEGTYEVVLVASDDNGNSDTKTSSVTVSTAQFSEAVLASTDGKSWSLAEVAGAMKVGPGRNNGEWFSTSENEPTIRPCAFNDEFIFSEGGGYEYQANGDIWHEAYYGGPEPAACANESELSAPWDAFASNASHTYEVDMSGEYPLITVKGTGAFIGLSKAFNGGELPNDGTGSPKSEITYEVLDYASAAGVETLVIGCDISAAQDASAYWTFTLTSN